MTGNGSPGGWVSGRQRLGALAVLVAALTAGAAAGPGASGWLSAGYVLAAVVALFHPAAITVQVVGGQLLAANLALAPMGSGPELAGLRLSGALLVPAVMAGVVVTAELLGGASRAAGLPAHDPVADLRRAGLSALLAGGVYGVVLAAAGAGADLRGPSGLAAIVVASVACVLIAVWLVRGVGTAASAGSSAGEPEPGRRG
jgi:hypothetical protein